MPEYREDHEEPANDDERPESPSAPERSVAVRDERVAALVHQGRRADPHQPPQLETLQRIELLEGDATAEQPDHPHFTPAQRECREERGGGTDPQQVLAEAQSVRAPRIALICP